MNVYFLPENHRLIKWLATLYIASINSMYAFVILNCFPHVNVAIKIYHLSKMAGPVITNMADIAVINAIN